MSSIAGQCRQFALAGTCSYGDSCRFQHTGAVQRGTKTACPKRRRRNVLSASNHLGDFFSSFELFTYNPASAATEEFHRLGQVYEWKRESDEREEARQRFKDAMVKEFNAVYGTDVDDITSWHGLYRVLNVSPPPGTLEACKEKVKGIHVNLVDLVGYPNSNEPLRKFRSEIALSEYSKETHKIFPRENAYAGGLLRFLLRQIDNPSSYSGNRNRQRKR